MKFFHNPTLDYSINFTSKKITLLKRRDRKMNRDTRTVRTMKCNYQVPQDFRDLTSAETAFHVIKKGSFKDGFQGG